MRVTPLNQDLIPQIHTLMELGAPYITTRTHSDYWLYAHLFASSCPVALDDNQLAGAVIAFRSQQDPNDVYIQDVITHPNHRRQGIATALLDALRSQATQWNCTRLYLTSEPDNLTAHSTWTALGFTNVQGDHEINNISVITDFKGPGKTRAIYELLLKYSPPDHQTDPVR